MSRSRETAILDSEMRSRRPFVLSKKLNWWVMVPAGILLIVDFILISMLIIMLTNPDQYLFNYYSNYYRYYTDPNYVKSTIFTMVISPLLTFIPIVTAIGLLFLMWAVFRRLHILVIDKNGIYFDCHFTRKKEFSWRDIHRMEKNTERVKLFFVLQIGEDEQIKFYLDNGKDCTLSCSDFGKQGILSAYEYISNVIENYSGKRIAPGRIITHNIWWS